MQIGGSVRPAPDQVRLHSVGDAPHARDSERRIWRGWWSERIADGRTRIVLFWAAPANSGCRWPSGRHPPWPGRRLHRPDPGGAPAV